MNVAKTIGFPPDLWEPLAELAAARHTSAAALIREWSRREIIAARKRGEITSAARVERARRIAEEESA